MRHVIPPIPEEVATLKGHLQHAHDGPKKPRLQMRYLLASGQAHTRQDVAHLLGVHRNPIGRWLALYAAGGLDALLATYVPAGKPVSLAPAAMTPAAGPDSTIHLFIYSFIITSLILTNKALLYIVCEIFKFLTFN
jgi:hypothetical protein